MLAVFLIPYNGLFSFVANFLNGESLDLAEFYQFRNSRSKYTKTHVTYISHEVYVYNYVGVWTPVMDLADACLYIGNIFTFNLQ